MSASYRRKLDRKILDPRRDSNPRSSDLPALGTEMEERQAVPKHHVRQEVCTTRPSYRDGRKSTAVKVYTVHQESRYLLIQNVPAVGAKEQLAKLLSAYGPITDLHPLDEYPADKFTEVYLVKFQRIQSARFAKKKLDDHSFFGGSLHVCYAPEHETVNETREKLQDRRKLIAAKIRKLESESKPSSTSNSSYLALPSSQHILAVLSPSPPSLPPPPLQAQPHLPLPPPVHVSQHLTTPVSSVLSMSTHNASPSTISHPGTRPHLPLPASSCTRPQGFPADFNSQDTRGVGGRGTITRHESIFHLPPPPMPGVGFDASQYRTPHVSKQNFGYAWVPSANSIFPPGYDPRLPQEDDEKTEEKVTHDNAVNVEIQNGSFVPSANVKTSSEARLTLVSSVSGASSSRFTPVRHTSSSSLGDLSIKSNDSSRSKDKVVVRQYKPKGPPPKFVPRQIKEKTGTQSSKLSSSSNLNLTKEEEVNREIRREAFQLGEDQGPSFPSDPEMREQLLGQRPLVEPSVESSVVASVKAIRKRMSKFISETVSKKLRTSDTGNKTDNKYKDNDSRDNDDSSR